jgi:hypothetical protein
MFQRLGRDPLPQFGAELRDLRAEVEFCGQFWHRGRLLPIQS